MVPWLMPGSTTNRKWQQSPNYWQPRLSIGSVQTAQNPKPPQQLNNIKQMVMSISDNYKCKAEFESKGSDALKKNRENIKQKHSCNATVREKSPMKEEENRKLHAIEIGLVEDGKTVIEQIQDLIKGECLTINQYRR